MSHQYKAATAVAPPQSFRRTVVPGRTAGNNGLHAEGLPSPRRNGQARYLGLLSGGQAFGQALVRRVHRTTSITRSAVNPDITLATTSWVEAYASAPLYVTSLRPQGVPA